jgi:hypothetical protein
MRFDRFSFGSIQIEARSEAPQSRIACGFNAPIEALEQSAEETNAILHVTC